MKIRRALHHIISMKSHFKHKALDRPKFAITMEVETKKLVFCILGRWKSALGTPIADERRYMDLVTGLWLAGTYIEGINVTMSAENKDAVHWNRYSWPYYFTNHKRNTENKKNGIKFTVWIVRHGEDPQTPRVVGHWFQSVVLYPWLAGTYIERWGKFSLWWARKTKTQYIGIGIPGRIISRTTRETQKTKKTESNLPCG